MNVRIPLVLGLALVVPACGNQPSGTPARDDPNFQLVTTCSAGVVANYKTSAEVATDLKSKISLGVNLEEAARGYIFEVLPEKDRLAGYEKYLACVKDRASAKPGY